MLIMMQLFWVLAKWPLDLTLRSQVLGSGQVVILAVDSFEREILKFNIDENHVANINPFVLEDHPDSYSKPTER